MEGEPATEQKQEVRLRKTMLTMSGSKATLPTTETAALTNE